MLIVSVSRSKGNYQGSDYDNINFQCFCDVAPKSLLAGQAVETVKVKTDVVIDCFGKSVSSIDWNSLVGSEILPTYNKFGQVSAISISYQNADVSVSTTSDGPLPEDTISDTSDKKSKKSS